MSWRFCNDDKKFLRQGGRKAPKITELEFKNHLLKYCKQYLDGYIDFDTDELEIEDLEECYDDFIQHLKVNFSKDVNVEFLDSDFDTNKCRDDIRLLGINTLKNGLVILGFTAPGNFDDPNVTQFHRKIESGNLFGCIYWDGKKFRFYFPKYGNCFNLITKTAFNMYDYCPNMGKYEKDYKKYFKVQEVNEDILYPITYSKIYGNSETAFSILNADALEEDICNRIEMF